MLLQLYDKIYIWNYNRKDNLFNQIKIMLLIWDIHINSKYKDKILNSIKDFIDNNPNEKNIVFLWDYVYHFSYDRKAILQLFDLFLDLYQKGKNVYVLSWNHDWIAESFVFEEVKKAFDVLNWFHENKITFITQPVIENIEDRDILFLPFNVNLDFDDKINPKYKDFVKQLLESKNKNEQFSWKINNILFNYLDKYPDLLVIHHYYFAWVQFPGQRARFNYKDIALSKDFLENYKDTNFISWHLHQGFIYNNYFCTGSVWSSSPLEQNQFKFLYTLNPKKLQLTAYNIGINPYISIDISNIDKNVLKSKLEEIFEDNKKNFANSVFNVKFMDFDIPSFSDITLILQSQEIDYDILPNVLWDGLINTLKEIRLKKPSPKLNQINDLLDTSTKNLQTNIADWKALSIDYIEKKFQAQAPKYIDKLKELKVL